jgi:putative MATE family efflux protein
MLVNMLAGALYTLANFFWLGKLGARAQAAVALATGPVSILQTLVPIITVGTRVLISQAVGAKNQDAARRVFNEAFGASVLVMSAVGLCIWLARAWFGPLLTPDTATATLIGTLLGWFIPSVAVQVPSATMAAAVGGTGNLRASVIAQLVAVGANVTISPLLIFGWLGLPALGIVGVGVGSLTSAVASVTVLAAYFRGDRSYLRFQPTYWFTRPNVLWRVFKIGLPVGIQNGVLALYLVVLIQFLRPFGPTEQAAFGIGQRLMQSATLPLIALSSAAGILVGQSYGAGLSARIKECFRASVVLGFVVTPVVFLAMQLFAQAISRAFNSDPAVIAEAAQYLHIVSLNLPLLAVTLCCLGVLTGLGNTKASLFAVSTSSVMLLLPCWWLSYSPAFSPTWIWCLIVASSALEMLMALAFTRTELRKPLRPSEPAPSPA